MVKAVGMNGATRGPAAKALPGDARTDGRFRFAHSAYTGSRRARSWNVSIGGTTLDGYTSDCHWRKNVRDA